MLNNHLLNECLKEGEGNQNGSKGRSDQWVLKMKEPIGCVSIPGGTLACSMDVADEDKKVQDVLERAQGSCYNSSQALGELANC